MSRPRPILLLILDGWGHRAETAHNAIALANVPNWRRLLAQCPHTLVDTHGEHAVKLTTARYFTPNGTSIQAAGIQPDIALADLALSQRNSEPTPAFGERDLPNHLKGANEGDGGDASGASKRDLQQDYALNEALNALKALALRRPAPAESHKSG